MSKASKNSLYTSNSDEHYTPKKIVETVLKCFVKVDLDPCSNSRMWPNVPSTKQYLQCHDGLSLPWYGKVFVNPPYSAVGAWVDKCLLEHRKYGAEILLLVAFRTDTKWFQKLSNFSVCFIDGRLKFVGNNNPATFPSCVFYLGDDHHSFVSSFSTIGRIYTPVCHG